MEIAKVQFGANYAAEKENQIISSPDGANGKKKIRILHVDDDDCVLQVSKEILEMDSNFEVDNVTSVAQAKEKMRNQKYAAIISDYEMPTQNGLEFLKELREQSHEIPFIMFTGKGREEVIIEALNVGASGYVNKQGDPETVYSELTHNVRVAVEKSQAEEALRDSEAKYSAMVRKVKDGVFITREQRLEYVNESLAKMLGYSVSEMENKSFLKFFPPESRESIAQRARDRFAGKGISSFYESKLQCKDGTIKDIELSGTLIQYGGKPANIGIIRDITERKKAEEGLRLSEEKYRSLFENAIDIIATHDLNGQITSANRAIEKYGFTKDSTVGRNILELISKENWPPIIAQLSEIAHGKSVQGETEVSTPVGMISAEYKSNPIWQGERVVGAQTLIRDISERKKAEEELKKSEEKYRNIVELCQDGIITVTMTGKITSVNNAFLGLTGFSEDEILDKHFTKLGTLRARDIPKYVGLFASMIRGRIPKKFEFTFERKDGKQRIGEAHISVMKEKGKKIGFQAILRDITESRNAAMESQKREHDFSLLLDSSFLGITHLDLQGKVTLINHEACKRLKGESVDLIGKNVHDLYGTKKGALIMDRINEAKLFGENRVYEDQAAEDSRNRWFRSIYNRITDEEGTMIGLKILSDDVTKEKTIEQALRKTSEELRLESDKLRLLNEKLEVVGKLTRHDLRNKLAAVKGYVYILSKRIGKNPEMQSYIEEINSSIDLTERLLKFTNIYEQIGSDQLTTVNIESCFNKSANLFSELKNLKVENKCQELEVTADAQLEQLFYNMIDNSLKHDQKVSRICLRCEKVANSVTIIYEDDGVGIPEENKPKLFSEGFSTGQGTGYGLSLMRRILQVYGWTIKEEGMPGKGVKFMIHIPNNEKICEK
jgi:PAS domain S-box-containing protein